LTSFSNSRAREFARWPAALTETAVQTPLVAPTDTKVSTTPSSNGFAFTLDGICVSHSVEPHMRNGQSGTLAGKIEPDLFYCAQ
jgi:hypothetical protein